jgi:hypothetical protein
VVGHADYDDGEADPTNTRSSDAPEDPYLDDYPDFILGQTTSGKYSSTALELVCVINRACVYCGPDSLLDGFQDEPSDDIPNHYELFAYGASSMMATGYSDERDREPRYILSQPSPATEDPERPTSKRLRCAIIYSLHNSKMILI